MKSEKNPSAATGNESAPEIPNGAAVAAILSAAAGCFLLSFFALLGDAFPALAHLFIFYQPTGPLSGVTTSAIILWLVLWVALARAWGRKSVSIGKINLMAFLLLIAAFLLSFPPFADLLQGK